MTNPAARTPRQSTSPAGEDHLHHVVSGIDTGHHPGFTIDRPHGWRDHLFLRFRTPMELITLDGRVTAEPGDCLIYPPGQPQWYRGRGVPFRDDWMHIEGSLVRELLARYQLPIGRVFTVQDSDFFPAMLSEIRRIDLFRRPLWEDELALAFQWFVLQLARSSTVQAAGAAMPITARNLLALQRTRMALHENLRRKWSVRDMARLAGLGPGRFTRLYRAAFGTSPTNDLIQTRVDRAGWLLKTCELSLEEISDECGFSSVYYFIRQFRKRLGITPGRFRARAT